MSREKDGAIRATPSFITKILASVVSGYHSLTSYLRHLSASEPEAANLAPRELRRVKAVLKPTVNAGHSGAKYRGCPQQCEQPCQFYPVCVKGWWQARAGCPWDCDSPCVFYPECLRKAAAQLVRCTKPTRLRTANKGSALIASTH